MPDPICRLLTARLLAALASVLWAIPPASALPSDSEQPIEIVADRAELDEATGTAVYIGNVQLDQGTLRVKANRMTIYTAEERVTRVRAEGGAGASRRAHYQQQRKPGGPLVQADANVITYYIDDERVKLEGDAELVQNEDRFAGGEIMYDIRVGQVDAAAAPSERVRMTLQPRAGAGTP